MDELYEYMNWKLAEMYQNGRGDIHIDTTHAFLIYHLICYMKQIKSIEYKVSADNDALQYAYDMGLDKIRLEKDSRLYIDVGVTTQIDAFMNFENKK